MNAMRATLILETLVWWKRPVQCGEDIRKDCLGKQAHPLHSCSVHSVRKSSQTIYVPPLQEGAMFCRRVTLLFSPETESAFRKLCGYLLAGSRNEDSWLCRILLYYTVLLSVLIQKKKNLYCLCRGAVSILKEDVCSLLSLPRHQSSYFELTSLYLYSRHLLVKFVL